MEPENIDASGPQTGGDAFEVPPGRFLAEQVAETVERAIGGIDGGGKAEVRHVGGESFRPQTAPQQTLPQEFQRRPAEVQPGHPVTAGGQFRHQPPAAAGRLEQSFDGKRAILATRRLDEVGLRAGFTAEGDVVIARMVVPVFLRGFACCHLLSPRARLYIVRYSKRQWESETGKGKP